MKFAPFFHGNAKYKITQTYHGEYASNPDNLTTQCAVDFSALGGAEVRAVHNGVIVKTGLAVAGTKKWGYYLELDIGESYNVLYVHIQKFLPKGTRVKRGQKICEVFYMQASHLHLALRNKSGKAPHPRLMNYVDRTVPYVSGHPEITAVWFRGGNPNAIDWNKFRDLSLTMPVNVGQKLEFTATMNLRDANYKDIGDIAKGAVAEVIAKGASHDGYQWYWVRFANKAGQVADTSRNKVTSKLITNINGNAPIDECKKKVEEAVKECTAKWSVKYQDEKKAKEMCQERNTQLEDQAKLDTQAIADLTDDKADLEEDISILEKENDGLRSALERCKEGNGGCLPLFEGWRNSPKDNSSI